VHWRKAVNPPYVSPRLRTRAYLPILRVSRRFLKVYRRAVCTGEWEGHCEFLLPTIARTFDLSIEDIGGAGPFTPAPRIGRNYMNTANDVALSPGTFVCAPSTTTYFHETSHQFHRRDMLYHPDKPFTGFRLLSVNAREMAVGGKNSNLLPIRPLLFRSFATFGVFVAFLKVAAVPCRPGGTRQRAYHDRG
jgi:hypothetical protein